MLSNWLESVAEHQLRAQSDAEVCTKYCLFDIGDYENPPEITTQPNIECAGTYTISHNVSAIHSLQGKISLWAWNKEMGIATGVMYIK